MKKEDQYQYNKEYFEDNQRMLDQPTYNQKLRQDRLTTTDEIKRELNELTEKQRQNEQTKAEATRRDAEEKERKERAEFEEWKRQKNQISGREDNEQSRTRNARTQE